MSQGWHAIGGDAAEYVSLEHFGASAAYRKLYQEFGLTADTVAAAARSSIGKARSVADTTAADTAAGSGRGDGGAAAERAASPGEGTGVPARDAASPQGNTVSED